MSVVNFPERDRGPQVPPYPPLERAVEAVERWVEAAQAALAGVPGATLEDQRVLRELAARLEQRALADALK